MISCQHNPVVYFVIDSATQGVDYMGWGYDIDAATHELVDMIGRGYEVEMRSYELWEVPNNLATMSGLYERVGDAMADAGL